MIHFIMLLHSSPRHQILLRIPFQKSKILVSFAGGTNKIQKNSMHNLIKLYCTPKQSSLKVLQMNQETSNAFPKLKKVAMTKFRKEIKRHMEIKNNIHIDVYLQFRK